MDITNPLTSSLAAPPRSLSEAKGRGTKAMVQTLKGGGVQ
jgi:hypothetical protein